MIRESTIRKYIGMRYGRLTIISFDRKEGSTQYFFNCRCDCGTVKTVRLSCMQQKTTTSCGCAQKEGSAKRSAGNTYTRLAFGENALNNLLSRYKIDAKRRNLIFNLSKEEFRTITSQDCFYCGKPPSAVKQIKNAYGHYTYNGIDRLDNATGYVVDNCVAACKDCNSQKNAISKEMVYKLYHALFKD